ncbi:MAG: hypothetical protein II269_09380 [Bacteroidaceae bacterium]|nr:hypothetical protein [Bacteroidaceae bacterium]
MKELSILGGATESFVMLYDKALLQVDGAGRYDVQASLDGEHWSVLTPITAKCDHHSRTIVLDLLAGAHIRVVCVTGTMEAARYSFDMSETSEAERIAAEEAREEAENKRVEAENGREVAEAAREAAEAQREKKINDLADAEATRVEKEIEREAAEAKRQATFTANEESRQSTFDTNEEARQSVFNANEEKREEADALREERTEEAIASIANKVDRTDNAPELTAGFAGNLVGRGEATSEEIGFRPSGGLTSVNDGAARIERMKGNTVVWNQRIAVDFTSITKDGLTVTNNSDGTITVNGANTGSLSVIVEIGRVDIYPQGHKMLLIGSDKMQGWTKFAIYDAYVGGNTAVGGTGYTIYTTTNSVSISLAVWAGMSIDNVTFRPLLYDLTQMFGAGNEPTTIEEFNARKPLGIDEYAYNEGELISTTADEIKSVGFNAWDGQLRAGFLNGDGITIADGSSSHTSNFVKVIPGATYYKNKSNANQTSFYDRNKSFLVGKWLNRGEFTIPNDCHFIKVDFPTADADSFCINLSHTGYRNGEYEPYEEFRRSLPISEIKDIEGNALFPNGLLSAGSVYDEITATKAIKRIGVVDMGTLTWNITGKATILINNIGVAKSVTENKSLLCSAYVTHRPAELYGTDKSGIAGPQPGYWNTICVYNSSYTDDATFKAAMNGVMLYYELNEPIEVDLPEPINMDYEVSDFGTEEVLSDTPTTPLKADIIYQFNAVDRIRENSLSLEDLIKRMAALEAQNAALVQQLNATGNGETE